MRQVALRIKGKQEPAEEPTVKVMDAGLLPLQGMKGNPFNLAFGGESGRVVG